MASGIGAAGAAATFSVGGAGGVTLQPALSSRLPAMHVEKTVCRVLFMDI
jgi:hypothetical protein